MQSSDKPTIITIGEDSHESESEENHALKLFKDITQEDIQDTSEMPLDLSIKNRNSEKTKISDQQSPNFQVQSVMPNLFLPSTRANFSPFCVSTSRPNKISSASSSSSMLQSGNIRARPSDSRRERILLKHQRLDKQTFACDICNKTFLQNCELKWHKMEHTDERPFVCDKCNKTFKRVGHLNSHQKEHSDVRPFACEICNKRHLKRHKIKHMVEGTYSCDECKKTFKYKGNLMRHKKEHSNERPFVCEICNKAFKQSSHLNSHRDVHSDKQPFECVECNKCFKRKNYLEAHKIKHTDERHFCCEQCNKKFKHRKSLYKHKKKHF